MRTIRSCGDKTSNLLVVLSCGITFVMTVLPDAVVTLPLLLVVVLVGILFVAVERERERERES